MGNVLTVQIKRFSATGAKIDRVMHLPRTLGSPNATFSLRATIIHTGGATTLSGHYITLAIRDDRWWKFDDGHVTPTTSDDPLFPKDTYTFTPGYPTTPKVLWTARPPLQ